MKNKMKAKALIPTSIYMLVSLPVWCFFYFTEIGGALLLFAILSLWSIYLPAMMWIPYILGKSAQRKGELIRRERFLMAFINAMVNVSILPFVELVHGVVKWGNWQVESFINEINPLKQEGDWEYIILFFITFLFFLIGEEVQAYRSKSTENNRNHNHFEGEQTMISIEEVICIYIEYRGSRQGLFTDYGSVFDDYLTYFEQELKSCSLFEFGERENTLSIRYRRGLYTIYHTDERAAVWGNMYEFERCEDAQTKYLELFQLKSNK